MRTVTILDKIVIILKKIEGKEVNIKVTREDFAYYLQSFKERMESSQLRLQFGHYKPAAHSPKLSTIHTMKMEIITQTGCAPKWWEEGLLVMLEKVAGVALVMKLSSILLLEADFNFHNRLIFESHMLRMAWKKDLVPDKIYIFKGRTAEDVILQQVLVYDLARKLVGQLW